MEFAYVGIMFVGTYTVKIEWLEAIGNKYILLGKICEKYANDEFNKFSICH